MGASTLGLDVTYRRAKVAAFEFGDVTEDTVEVAKLDQFLSDADVNPLSQHVGSLLEADDDLCHHRDDQEPEVHRGG